MYIPSIIVDWAGLQDAVRSAKGGHLHAGKAMHQAVGQPGSSAVLIELQHACTHTDRKGTCILHSCFHAVSVHLSCLWEDMVCIQQGSFLPVTAQKSNFHWTLPQSYRGVFHWPQTFLSTVKSATNTDKGCFTALPMHSHVQHLREEKAQADFWFR